MAPKHKVRKDRGDRWRLAALGREALRNVFSVRSKLFAAAILAVLLGIALSMFRSLELHSLEGQVSELRAGGRNVVLVRGVDHEQKTRIDRHSCEQLSELGSVVRAGALIEYPREYWPQLGASVPRYGVSATLLPQLSQAELVIGSELLDAPSGTQLLLAHDAATFRGVAGERQPLGLSVNNAVSTRISPLMHTVDHCMVVLVDAAQPAQLTPTLLAQLVVGGQAVAAQALVPQQHDPYGEFLHRPGRLLPLGLGLVMGAFLAGIARLRSSELASYRLSGTARSSLLRLLMLEAVVVGGVAWLAGAAAALPVLSFGTWNTAALLGDQLLLAGSALFMAFLAFAVISRQSPMTLAKDR